LLLDVTQADIDAGKPQSCFHCAVAKALPRAKRGVRSCGVTYDRVSVEYRTAWKYYKVNRKLRKFLQDFDAGLPCKPAKFYLKRVKFELGSLVEC
jgi:hypothetical protein